MISVFAWLVDSVTPAAKFSLMTRRGDWRTRAAKTFVGGQRPGMYVWSRVPKRLTGAFSGNRPPVPPPVPPPAHVPNSLPWRGELAAVTHLTHGSLQRIADSQHGVVRESELVEWMFICSIAILQSHMLVVIHCRQEIPARFQENFSLGIPFTF